MIYNDHRPLEAFFHGIRFSIIILCKLKRGGIAVYYVGIDLGGTNVAAGMVDGEGRLLAKASVPCPRGA